MATTTARPNNTPGRGLGTSLILVRETLTGIEWDEDGGHTTKQCNKRKPQANREVTENQRLFGKSNGPLKLRAADFAK